MNKNNINMVMMSIDDCVENDKKLFIRKKLETADDSKAEDLLFAKRYDSMTVLLLSIFLGSLGVDRFYLKDVGRGVAKLAMTVIGAILCFASVFLSMIGIMHGHFNGVSIVMIALGCILLAVAGIWALVDIFFCWKKSREMNFKAIMDALSD